MNLDISDIPVLAKLSEAAKYIGLSERMVWQMGREGKIGTERQGRAVLYLVREFVQKVMDRRALQS